MWRLILTWSTGCMRAGINSPWVFHPTSPKVVKRDGRYICEVCGLRWRTAPAGRCGERPVYDVRDQPSNLATRSELVWMGLGRPESRSAVLTGAGSERHLYSVSLAAEKATPVQRRRVVVETFIHRHCRTCLTEIPERKYRFGPHLCSVCERERAPYPFNDLRLPSEPRFALEDGGRQDFRDISVIVQLIEFEARGVIERAEVARGVEHLEALQAADVETHDLERIDRAYARRTYIAPYLIPHIRAWREKYSIPELEAVDGAVLECALQQALARLDFRDPLPNSPIVGTWPWQYLVVWLHYLCAQAYAGRAFEKASRIEAAREELCERLALLWWYENANSVAGQQWLVDPAVGWGAKEISSVGEE